MNGPEFTKPIQPNIAGSGVHETVDRNRQQKVAELKARVQSGQYRVNVQTLAQRIQESGVFDHE